MQQNVWFPPRTATNISPSPPPQHTQGRDESSQEYDHIKTDQEGEEEGEKDSQSTGSAEGMCTCMHNQLTAKNGTKSLTVHVVSSPDQIFGT